MSSEYKVCYNDAHPQVPEWHTLFWVKTTSARSITEFTSHEKGEEFVLLPATKLKIVNKTKNDANYLHIVTLEEIFLSRENADESLVNIARNSCSKPWVAHATHLSSITTTNLVVPDKHDRMLMQASNKSPEIAQNPLRRSTEATNVSRKLMMTMIGLIITFIVIATLTTVIIYYHKRELQRSQQLSP